MDFASYLKKSGVPNDLAAILINLSQAVMEIARSVATSQGDKVDTQNIFGEEQLKLDLEANKILEKKLTENPAVAIWASEEEENEVVLNYDGRYGVCFDPLDGSSLVDVNLTVGTIIGIYDFQESYVGGREKTFIGRKGRDQVAALVAVYGPRTTFIVTLGKGVMEFTLDREGVFVLTRGNCEIMPDGKMFAPGNLRASKFRRDYFELLQYWVMEQYTLRYSGGMVPDIYQIILKGKGVFAYPGYEDQPDGKLRLLFECAPMAFIVQQAGGYASDGKQAILDKPLETLAQRTPIFIGSVNEVKRCESYLA